MLYFVFLSYNIYPNQSPDVFCPHVDIFTSSPPLSVSSPQMFFPIFQDFYLYFLSHFCFCLVFRVSTYLSSNIHYNIIIIKKYKGFLLFVLWAVWMGPPAFTLFFVTQICLVIPIQKSYIDVARRQGGGGGGGKCRGCSVHMTLICVHQAEGYSSSWL